MREDISSKLIPIKNCSKDVFFIELNLKRKKKLWWCTYSPHWNIVFHHVSSTGKKLDLLLAKYDHIFLSTDFNAELQNFFLNEFCELYNLWISKLIKDPTFFKSPENSICVEPMLTNSYRSWSGIIRFPEDDCHHNEVTLSRKRIKK